MNLTKIGKVALTISLFIWGFDAGLLASHHIDPLRQDAPAVEDFFAANTLGDAGRMWADSSLDYRQHTTREDFMAEFSHLPSNSAPRRTFVASVPLAGGGKEFFYDLDFGKQGHATISLYTNGGKFDGFAE